MNTSQMDTEIVKELEGKVYCLEQDNCELRLKLDRVSEWSKRQRQFDYSLSSRVRDEIEDILSYECGFDHDALERQNILRAQNIVFKERILELESHLRAVCGLTVESGVKKIVETMNAAAVGARQSWWIEKDQ